ncbi:MAG: oxidoreductase [Ginsengibacter sp.]
MPTIFYKPGKISAFALLILFTLFYATNITAQTVKILTTDNGTSIRGLSVVTDKVVWVSGSNGKIGKSPDGGNSWKWLTVKGFENTDFRDIEAFSSTSAIIMGIDSPAYILKTIDGGDSWKLVYTNHTKGIFLDAMEFWNEQSGIIIGDPIDNKMYVIRTFDGGNNWQEIPPAYRPVVDSGEACFASSGTNVRKLTKSIACFITGGLRSRLFYKEKKIDLPIIQGKQSTGANSFAVKNKNTMIVVGGDFNMPDSTDGNCAISTNGAKTFTTPSVNPHGYRSCVEYLNKTNWISSGINGVDYSADDGNTWNKISSEGFHVCRKAKKGKAIFLAGSKGKIGKVEW